MERVPRDMTARWVCTVYKLHMTEQDDRRYGPTANRHVMISADTSLVIIMPHITGQATAAAAVLAAAAAAAAATSTAI